MLLTRCPDCGTTFRVTDEALTKANGQVRCGRCASVFNAYAELREPPSDATPQETPPGAAIQDSKPGAASQEATLGAASEATPGAATSPQAPLGPTASQEPLPGTEPHSVTAAKTSPARVAVAPVAPAAGAAPEPTPAARGATANTANERVAFSVADVVAQVGLIADEDSETGELQTDPDAVAYADAMSAEQVDSVLDAGVAPAPWPLSARPKRSSRWWAIAAAVAVAALGAQAVHHFRADLVSYAVIGPIVKDAYGILGTKVSPRWDVHQYQILDWVATAEPSTRGRGNLKITARIQNRARQSQPYPSVHVQLKDRWEAAVGSRVFAPKEYGARANDMMAPGETTRAEIEVVDPGPDAYGFELDVCIEVETDVISCGADKVFL
jgi:predicted Zn finger-like uncharacterized protein